MFVISLITRSKKIYRIGRSLNILLNYELHKIKKNISHWAELEILRNSAYKLLSRKTVHCSQTSLYVCHCRSLCMSFPYWCAKTAFISITVLYPFKDKHFELLSRARPITVDSSWGWENMTSLPLLNKSLVKKLTKCRSSRFLGYEE